MTGTLAGGAARDVAVRSISATAPIVDKPAAKPDHAGLDRAFAAPGSPEWDAAIARYRAATAAAQAQLAPGTARYGARPREALDIYAPEGARAAPVMVFIPGGGWQHLSKDEAGIAAPAFVAAGMVYVALDMTPLPDGSLAALLNQARRAIKWLHAHVAAHGGDPARLNLCGHGSGAHVAAMLAGSNWRGDGLPRDVIKSALLVSGLYDLEPLAGAQQTWLALDRVAALRLSPIRSLPPPTCRVLVAHAARESEALAHQSDAYALALRASGGRVETLVVPGADHWSAIETLADPQSVLGAAALELAQR
jgi:arylformamidase